MENKIRPYRIIIHNLTLSEKEIKGTLESEIKNAELVNFEIETTNKYEAPISGEAVYDGEYTPSSIFPQKDTVVKLNYRENKTQ